MIRATTGGVMRTYRSNLMNSFINMNANRNTVLTQRTFNSFAEDPAAAAKAFRLRKSRMTVESQYAICTDAIGKYQQAVSCLQSVDDVLCTKEGEYGYYMKTLTGTTLSMLNDPTGDAREQLSKALDQLSQQIIQTMNQKYGDNFIFAGADGHNVPFEIVNDKLYYRGVPVDAAVPNVLKDADGNPICVSDNGAIGASSNYYLELNSAQTISIEEYERLYTVPELEGGSNNPTVYDSEGREYGEDGYDDSNGIFYKRTDNEELISKTDYEDTVYRAQRVQVVHTENEDSTEKYPVTVDKDGNYDENGGYYLLFNDEDRLETGNYNAMKLDVEKLQYLAQETEFVDIGYGFQEDPVTGKLIETSAFNVALNGINFLGYGLDEDGDPKNIYSLIQKMREVAGSVDSGTDWDNSTYNKFYKLVQKLEDAVSTYQTEYVNLDASTGKLRGQQELLVDNFDTLQEQYSDIEDVDMVDAITSFIWAEYCYNAALKVGNSILSESLMDYLR